MEPIDNTNKTIDIAPPVSTPKNFNDAVAQNQDFSSVGTGIFRPTKSIRSSNYAQGRTGWSLDSNGQLQFNNPVPTTAAAAGIPGMIAYDATHIYVCVAVNTWCRAAIATF